MDPFLRIFTSFFDVGTIGHKKFQHLRRIRGNAMNSIKQQTTVLWVLAPSDDSEAKLYSRIFPAKLLPSNSASEFSQVELVSTARAKLHPANSMPPAIVIWPLRGHKGSQV